MITSGNHETRNAFSEGIINTSMTDKQDAHWRKVSMRISTGTCSGGFLNSTEHTLSENAEAMSLKLPGRWLILIMSMENNQSALSG